MLRSLVGNWLIREESRELSSSLPHCRNSSTGSSLRIECLNSVVAMFWRNLKMLSEWTPSSPVIPNDAVDLCMRAAAVVCRNSRNRSLFRSLLNAAYGVTS